MRFVETPVFSASLRRLLDEEQYRKNEQGDLTPAQLRVFVRLVRQEFK